MDNFVADGYNGSFSAGEKDRQQVVGLHSPPAGHNKTTGIGADAFAHVDSRGDKKTHAQHLARLFAGPENASSLPQQFTAWIKPLKAIEFDASTGDIHLRAPNRLKLDAVRAQFAARIQAVVSSLLKRPVKARLFHWNRSGRRCQRGRGARGGATRGRRRHR